jgi:hypothetical protein
MKQGTSWPGVKLFSWCNRDYGVFMPAYLQTGIMENYKFVTSTDRKIVGFLRSNKIFTVREF